jgi:glycine dehydrogenase subunit 2
MKQLAHEGETNPEALHNAPVTTPIGRPDDVKAARMPIVKFCE